MRTYLSLKVSEIEIVNLPLSIDNMDVSRYLHKRYKNLRDYPITIFKNILCKSNIPYVDNLLKRLIILDALNMKEENYLREFCNRIDTLYIGQNQTIEYQKINKLNFSSFSLLDLPFLKYQPKDAGRYLTSFVLCIEDSEGRSNLGFYRGEIKNEDTIAIFIDPRTDAYRIIENRLQYENKIFISLFNGGPIANYISAASKIPKTIDSYLFAKALAKQSEINYFKYEFYPAVPKTSEIVLYGYTEGKKITEGPFCEFKGYYSEKTYSYEFKINKIYTKKDPYFFGLFCGKESGLNLMQFQNETFMFYHLIKQNLPVKKVIYPYVYFAEFCTIIVTEQPNKEILKTAMEYDTRSKIFFIVRNYENLFSDLAIFKFSLIKEKYFKKGVQIGDRIGIIMNNENQYEWAKY
ncbi:MAG: UbiD family decarboxylase domain-containing protein [Candidatus Dasytiphilus stammeri]